MLNVNCRNRFIRRVLRSTLKNTLFFGLLVFLTSFSNLSPVPKYISIAFIKSASPDFILHEKSFWVPVQHKLIKAGRKDAWYMYKIKSKDDKELPFDYIRFNVFHDKEQSKDPYRDILQFVEQAYPGQDMNEQIKKTNSTRVVVWEQLYEIKDGTATSLLNPKDLLFININPTNPSVNKNLKLIAIEPFKKENLYTQLEIVDSKKRFKGERFRCKLVVSADEK